MTEEPTIQKVEFPDEKGGLTVQAKHPAFAALALECVKMFREAGGVNYCEWTMTTEDVTFGQFTVLIQRKAGKTPAERVKDLELQNHEYRTALARARQELERSFGLEYLKTAAKEGLAPLLHSVVCEALDKP